VYATVLEAGKDVSLELAPGRAGWVQVARGSLLLNGGTRLEAGDGAALEGEPRLSLRAETGAEALVFDLA
jgi:redox-sensitive bicupin YhaK (pirin superfamily)